MHHEFLFLSNRSSPGHVLLKTVAEMDSEENSTISMGHERDLSNQTTLLAILMKLVGKLEGRALSLRKSFRHRDAWRTFENARERSL